MIHDSRGKEYLAFMLHGKQKYLQFNINIHYIKNMFKFLYFNTERYVTNDYYFIYRFLFQKKENKVLNGNVLKTAYNYCMHKNI